MPDHFVHFKDFVMHRDFLRGKTVVPLPANSNLSAKDQRSRPGARAEQTLLLRMAPVRLNADAKALVAKLVPRTRARIALVQEGTPGKSIAPDPQISRRAVENPHAPILRWTAAASLPALVRQSMGVA